MLLLLLFTSVSAMAQSDNSSFDFSPSAKSLVINAQLYTRLVEAKYLTSRLAGTTIEGTFSYTMSKQFTALVNGGIRLEAGSSRALYNDEFAPRQSPLLREGSVDWQPISFCHARAGTLNQAIWQDRLLVWEQSFPGVLESCGLNRKRWSLLVSAEQSYAADTQFSHPTGRELTDNAQFYIERLQIGYQAEWGVYLWMSHYLFDNLSTLAAYQSQFMGNSSSGLDDRNADFSYGFQGYEWGAGVRGRLGRFPSELRVNFLQNQAAPRSRNQAYIMTVSSTIPWSSTLAMSPSLLVYRADSDVTPAYFNDSALGHANVSGYGAALDFNFQNPDFSAAVRFVHAQPKDASFFQSEQNWLLVTVRLINDII